MKRVSVLMATFAALCVGCSRPSVYWSNRGCDFLDCLKLQGGVRYGLDVQVRATNAIAQGAGFSVGRLWGLDRGAWSTVRSGHMGPPIVPLLNPAAVLGHMMAAPFMGGRASTEEMFALALQTDMSETRAIPTPDTSSRRTADSVDAPLVKWNLSVIGLNVDSLPGWTGWFPVGKEHAEAYRRQRKAIDSFDLEVEATCVVLGARVGFSPGQFLDFLLGWTALDIGGDDAPDEPSVAPAPQ